MFKTFTFPLVQGDPNTALNDLSSMVITEKMARDLFGDGDPIGQSVRTDGLNGGQAFRVTGVMANVPPNSSFRFDALVRPESRADYQPNKADWGNRNHEVYLKLKPGVDALTAEKRLQSLTRKYWQADIAEAKKRGEKPDARGEYVSLRLQPLTDIRFDTKGVMGQGISRTYVSALALIGLFILLIAGINYVNLSLARSITRAREVGVRKSLGAQPGQLFGQFWAESLLICLIALAAGLALTIVQPGVRYPAHARFAHASGYAGRHRANVSAGYVADGRLSGLAHGALRGRYGAEGYGKRT